MSYEIPQMFIEENSPEGQNIHAIIKRDHVTAEEAVRRVLRQSTIAAKSPGEELIGIGSSTEDRALLDEVIAMAKMRRKLDVPRDF